MMRESIFGRPRTNPRCVTFVLMQMDSVNGSTQVTMRHLLQQFLPKASSPIIPRVSEQLSLQVFEAFRHGGVAVLMMDLTLRMPEIQDGGHSLF